MTERELGRSGRKPTAVGLGRMGMSELYDRKQLNDAASGRVIHRYLETGVNFLDSAAVYGVRRNSARQW